MKLLTIENSTQPQNEWTARGSYELNPQWLITHYKLLDGFTEDIEYTEFEGRKLPLRLTLKPVPDMRPTLQVDFQNYKAYKGHIDDFSLTRYGLPELGRPLGSWRNYVGCGV